MATIIITVKLMPSSVDADIEAIREAAVGVISKLHGTVGKAVVEPVAFGLNALVVMFSADESMGSTEALEQRLAGIDGVQSVQVLDVRRAVG